MFGEWFVDSVDDHNFYCDMNLMDFWIGVYRILKNNRFVLDA